MALWKSVWPRGSEFGPCADDCTHPTCQLKRAIAESACTVCHQPIGYDTPYYTDLGNTHAECYQARFKS